LRACRAALAGVVAEAISAPFAEPVDLAAFPDYRDFVTTPMALNTVGRHAFRLLFLF
jgi:hypothetical protein